VPRLTSTPGARIVAGVLTGAYDRSALESAPHTYILDSVGDLPALIKRSTAEPRPAADVRGQISIQDGISCNEFGTRVRASGTTR
jgi:hypothetical protein